ncbi:MAG: hypothetical protein JWM21_4681 [Acidobacteria bacterium]|nr:hypothetical protein [Acidobacteriota bacterium]
MKIRYCLVPLILCLSPTGFAQSTPQGQSLTPGQRLEREMAGGESHTYQLKLQAGQFMRVMVEQKGVDVVVGLVAPDGRQLVEANLFSGGQESISHEALVSGDYQIVVRAVDAKTPKGRYEVQLELKAVATTQDKQRIAAERLLAEANKLSGQGAAATGPTVAKAQLALALWREIGDRYWQAQTLDLIGLAFNDGSKFEQAIESYNQALTIRREVKDRYGEADTINRLGGVYYTDSRYEKAIDYYDQALVLYRQLKYRMGEGDALYNLGITHRVLGRSEKAIEYLEHALAIYRELGNRAEESNAIRGLGALNNRISRYEKAIEYFEQALAISREVKNREYEGRSLFALGNSYWYLGRYEKAIEYHEQGLAISREVKSLKGEGDSLGNLGLDYDSLGQYEKAVGYYEQGLALNRLIKDRSGEGNTLTNLGGAYNSLGRYVKAVEYLEQSLAITREIKSRFYEEATLNILGEVYRLQGLTDKATQVHIQALAIAREIKAQFAEAEALKQLMLDWKARNAANPAIYFGKQAVNTYQEIRSNIRSLDANSQRGFLKSKEPTYRDLADLLISQGRLPEAEQVIRMLKAEEYFEYIRRDPTNAPQGQKAQLTPEEAALEKRYREIAEQLAALGAERGTLMDKKSRTPQEEQRLAKLDADLVVAGNAFQKFLDQLTTELGSSAESGGRVFQLRESQGLMEDLRELGQGVVALYTLVGEDRYRVILTTADFQKGYEYPIKASDLNRKVLEFREALQNPKLDPLPLAQELYKILLGPVAKDLAKARAQTIMWSLDGVLRYVPVSALNDGKRYLVEQYQNVVFTPASQARLKDAPARNWNALGLGVSKAHGERIPALPGVLDEMRGIIRDEAASHGPAPVKQSGVLPGVVKLDEQFTEEAMLTQLRQRPKVVHIASHFQFSPGNETNSALLLGDGTFLSLAQIKSLPNIFGGVDLLTLSACNTATGGSGANGKEVEGFGVLAQRQGAKAVVASLWPVADRSTRLLMQEFYRSRESQAGMSKIAALREAQLKLLRGEITVDATQSPSRQITHEDAKPEDVKRPLFKLDPQAPFAHPYYWAPFILIGNWK